MSQCSAEPHKLRRPGATPGPAIFEGGIVKDEGRSISAFILLPSTVSMGPVVQRRRHLRDMQETMVQLHPGSLERSAGVSAAHVRGKDEDRVQFPGGPLQLGLHADGGD